MYDCDGHDSTGTACVLCETAVPPFGDPPLILSGFEGPILSGTTTPHDQGSALHKGCLETIRKIFQRRKKFDLTRRLWLLQRTRSLLWPISSSTRHTWVRQFAGRSVNELVRTSEVLTELGYHMKRLPKEILEHIGGYSHPSSLTGFAILRQNALFINMCEVDENLSRIISLPDGRLSVSFRRIFQHTYVADVAPVEARPNDTTGFLLCTDGIACQDVKRADRIRYREGQWYRHVRATGGDKLLLVYKGICLQDILNLRLYQESYLYDQTKLPTLQSEHCFGLPATDLSLDQLIENPIRLRQTCLEGNPFGIIVACLGSTIIALRAHHGASNDLDVYKRIDEMPSGKRLLTSYGRVFRCGHYITPAKLEQYRYCTLVNDESLYVSEIYLADSYGVSRTLRAGAVCQQIHRDSSRTAMNLWNIVESPTSIPKAVGHGHRYFGRVNASLFSSFSICVEEGDVSSCLGIRFHGNIEPTVIGQWRLDRAMISGDLPTTIGLCNNMHYGKSFVAITRISQASESISLAGILEWWIGPKGSEIVRN
ncbi:hypothetical protein M409DRAFT_61736 [Zasmidium cellare ATCC 36951]|uniref:Uncharacterized protein n=1 Tax=Zasmidium cellare ATCC 36951 TaxID=1080233 RepID=A0A6A6BWD3_ZASCE|nr:uncharacterized protein M409DRAFT_61736 [Zasmidium cellare ATCC 36951]KAF2158348.1 hypothetical protein M409DRAFT_61736 [Zasmidium cellare ATCC 36951]